MEQQGKFILMTSGEFGAWIRAASVSRVIRLIQNHHTYIPGYAHFKGNNHFELLRGIEYSHIQRGFAEIAQHITTFPDGRVAVCRPLDKIPAGIKGANQFGICIENVGNFDAGGDVMADPHKAAIVQVNAMLCSKFGLVPGTDTIVYHHWFDLNSGARTDGAGVTKSCPGTAFFGGNTLAAATSGFIPLVQAELAVTGTGVPNLRQPELYEVVSYGLNVRSGPGIAHEIIKTLQMGTVVSAYEEKDGWLRIDPRLQQWISKSFLKKI